MSVEIISQTLPDWIAQNPPIAAGAIPGPKRRYSELYSNKHDKILLRTEHIEMMNAIRQSFNNARLHAGQRALTTGDIVNACLDFVFEHPIPIRRLSNADELRELIGEYVYRSAVSRWRQFNEVF